MKKITAWILVLVLCLGLFAGCTQPPVGSTPNATTGGTEENEGLTKAAKYVKALYINAGTETGIDFTRTTVVPVGKVQYTITWSVDVTEDLVKIVVNDDNTVTVDINDDNQTETPYKLTATISDDKGNTKEVVFDHILPKAIPKDGTEFSVKEIIDMGSAKDHNTYTDYKYKVTGVITEVYNTQYGNMYITDGEGNTLTIYGTYSADGSARYDAMEVKPVAGDTVTIYGIVGQYNGTAQIKNGWIVAHTPGEGPVDPPAPPADEPAADSTLSVKDAIDLGASKEHNAYTAGKYYVTGIITEVYNEQYGNMKIKDAEGNILTVYGTYNADGTVRYDALEVKPVAGDEITVYGIIGQYNGTPQIKNGWITKHTAAGGSTETPTEPVTPPASLSVVDSLTVGTAYKFGMVQQKAGKTVYLKGGMDGYYMATTEDASAAIDVFVEEANGGYYLYAMIDGTKTYINMVISGTHVNGAYEATASTVYTWDAEAKTLIAIAQPEGKDAEPYWFGTRNDKTYLTVGPCAVSYAGFYCQFYA